MKTLSDLLTLGDPLLYEKCAPIEKEEMESLGNWVSDLHNVMEQIRRKYQFGRGIAAPQLGNMKQLIYINVDKPLVIINPRIIYKSDEMIELWDDCMCFPHLLVKVIRHKSVTLEFKDENWNNHNQTFHDDMSELVQHEYDHLQGILCTMRAIDNKSFKWRQV